MPSGWILCPNLRGARLFQFEDLDNGVSFAREFKRPDIQLRDADFDSDEDMPEVLTDAAKDQLEREIAESYSKYLSRELDRAFAIRAFDKLVICAEARLLEILLRSLSASVRRQLLGTVEQDLYNINESDLVSYVRDLPGQPKVA